MYELDGNAYGLNPELHTASSNIPNLHSVMVLILHMAMANT